MPSRVVLVHDDREFLDTLVAILAPNVTWFTDPAQALVVLESAESIKFLVTRLQFSNLQSVGLSLARLARKARPDVRVIFTGHTSQRAFARGLGEFIPEPVQPEHVAMVIEWLSNSDDDPC